VQKQKPVVLSPRHLPDPYLRRLDTQHSTPIFRPADIARLAVGRLPVIAVKTDGQFTTAKVMKLTMSADHRVIDGAVGAAFLQTLKKFLENPVGLLL